MATKPTPKNETETATFTPAQVKHLEQIVRHVLENDDFDVSLPHENVVEAVREVLRDETVAKWIANLKS